MHRARRAGCRTFPQHFVNPGLRQRALITALACLMIPTSTLAQTSLLPDSTVTPVRLTGGWRVKDSASNFLGEFCLYIDKVSPDGAFTGKLDFLGGRLCEALEEPIKGGRMTADQMRFVAFLGSSAQCGDMAFVFRRGKDKFLEGTRSDDVPVWLNAPEAVAVGSACPTFKSLNPSPQTVQDIRRAGGSQLSADKVRTLLAGAFLERQRGEWNQVFEHRPNGDLWVRGQSMIRPKSWALVGEWRVTDDGAYCLKINWRTGLEDWCQHVFAYEGSFYFSNGKNIQGRLTKLVFREGN